MNTIITTHRHFQYSNRCGYQLAALLSSSRFAADSYASPRVCLSVCICAITLWMNDLDQICHLKIKFMNEMQYCAK
jgi:hypothetical protein